MTNWAMGFASLGIYKSLLIEDLLPKIHHSQHGDNFMPLGTDTNTNEELVFAIH